MPSKPVIDATTASNQRDGWHVFAIACIAIFMVSLDTTVLYAGFSNILHSFPDAKASDLSWAMNAYSIVYAAMLIPAGGIADTFGRKKTFLWGVAIFIAASLACGVAPSVWWLIVARVAQSLGACLLSPAALAIVLAAFPSQQRMVVMGAWGAVGGLAAALGPGIGSLIIDLGGWRWAFLINIPIGLLCIALGLHTLHESIQPSAQLRLDWIGMLQLILGVGALAFSIVELNDAYWPKSWLLTIALFGVLMLMSYLPWAKRNPNPLFELRLFHARTFLFANLAGFVFAIAFALMFFAFFFWMKHIWHFSQSMAGAAIMPGPLMVVPVAFVSGKWAAKHGHRPLLILGSLAYACSAAWFLWVPDRSPDYVTEWLPGLLLSGLAVGLVLPSLSAAAVFGLPAKDYAVGSAIHHAIRQMGTVLGVAIIILLLAHPHLDIVDFRPVYSLHMLLALGTLLLSLPIHTRPTPSQPCATE